MEAVMPTNGLSVDVEDWFHVGAFEDVIERDQWATLDDRVDRNVREILDLFDEARATAIAEGQRLVGDARQEALLEQSRARDALRKDVAQLAVAGASRLLEREIDPKAHAELIEKLAREIEGAKA